MMKVKNLFLVKCLALENRDVCGSLNSHCKPLITLKESLLYLQTEETGVCFQ